MVYTSSIFSFFTCLNMAAYSVSKRGLEAFADCLRVEMASFGVKVRPPGSAPLLPLRSNRLLLLPGQHHPAWKLQPGHQHPEDHDRLGRLGETGPGEAADLQPPLHQPSQQLLRIRL